MQSLNRKAILIALAGCVALLAALPVKLPAASLMDQGIAEYNAGRYERAVGLFGEAEPTNFNNPVLHYYLGNALAKLNQKPDAIKQYKLALILDPTDQVAEYCKKALTYLEDKPGDSSAAATKIKPSQTAQMFVVVCGCPLCSRMDMVLLDVQRKYAGKLLVTRVVRQTRDQQPSYNRTKYAAPSDAAEAKNQAVIARYEADQHCPTVLLFGTDGELTSKMTGFVPEPDIWKAVDQLMQAPLAVGAVPSDAVRKQDKIEDMRSTITRDTQAKLADAQKLQQEEIRRVELRLQQDLSDLSSSRRGGYLGFAYQDMHAEAQKRIEQVNADFEKKKKMIMDDAASRISGLGSR